MVKTPFGVDIDNLIEDLKNFSWEASETLLYYSKILKNSDKKNNIIKLKENQDPVTLADLKVNEIIIQKINKAYKNIDWNILSEENSNINSRNFNTKIEWLWILDPLDGTKDFIQGTGNYAMHLALNHNQKPFMGVVLIPEKNELWISNGEKVWCESKDGTPKKFKMSSKKEFSEMTIVTSKNHHNPNLESLISKMDFKNIIKMGSIGCKIASILRGESDIYISFSLPFKSCPKDWDFAAPEAILKAAGGAITNLLNEDLIYNKKNYEQGGIIIASNNKKTHKRKCIQLQEIIKKFDLFPLN